MKMNKNMIEKFKQINDVIHFNFYYFETFDEFVNLRIEIANDSCCDFNCKCTNKNCIKNKIDFFKNEMKCNNENTIVFANRVSNCDCDDYLLINFENNNMFLTSNDEQIENYNDDVTKNILYEMLKLIFESRKYCYNNEKNVINENDDVFECVEKIIDDCDFFTFYYFNDFIEKYNDKNNYDFDCDVDVEMYDEYMHYIDLLKNKYHCNNDNTIVLLSNCDNDEYLIINFEYNMRVLTENIYFDENEINDEYANDALYRILFDLFVDDLY